MTAKQNLDLLHHEIKVRGKFCKFIVTLENLRRSAR